MSSKISTSLNLRALLKTAIARSGLDTRQAAVAGLTPSAKSLYVAAAAHERQKGLVLYVVPTDEVVSLKMFHREDEPLEQLLLDAEQKRSTIILTNNDGKPWSPDGLRASWGKACKKAGIVGVTFHDLRGTAVTRLALAGCTEAEIATITGH